ncbi:hypothetical protein E4U57_003765 [Claviceps arundinis]|uniref:SMODS and SLOG-associating 2TM effector domain-containing protein n=1 Tax=Claviceps arundinis TaxID=1623583 RepID=A0A9P7SNP5_9HYPO|nr:hypothetical protein E4U57_003765 [Claviceps arundinis]KAG5962463.1 hypothetical protein E4U56_003398 [Claviceps arundinis]
MSLVAAASSSSPGQAKDKMPEIGTPAPDADTTLPNTHESDGHHKVIAHRFLSSAEWSSIANGLGGVKDGETALTALGSMSLADGKPITILGAANTVIAGLLALFHNSGIPDRYWNDMAEFEDIEDHIKEILDSGIVPAGQSAPQVLAECFDYFRDAKTTIVVNLPANYSSKQSLRATKPQNTTMPPPAGQPGSSAAPNAEGPA